MRGLLCFSLLAGLLLGGLPARAEEQTLPEIKVKVGEAAPLHLGWILLGAVCDDNSLVKIEDGGDHLLVVGLAPGKTQCGFWRDYGNPAPAAVYQVVVSGSSSKR
jgi:hypothetical protein